MKEIVKIIRRGSSEACLISLREKSLAIRDITISNRSGLNRITNQNELDTSMKSENIDKVIALQINDCLPCISIKEKDSKYLFSISNSTPYIEIECDKDGYPILNEDGRLKFYNFYPGMPLKSTTEALERIKQLNESYTNNHKLTPGLHKSS